MEEDEAKAEDDISDSFTDRRLIDDEWIAISKDDHGKGKEEVMIKGGMDPGSNPICFSLSSSTVWARCPGLRGILSQHFAKRLLREREDTSRSITDPSPRCDSHSNYHYHSHCSSPFKRRITFAFEANEETLLYIIRYINTGILLFPTLYNPLDLTTPLELIRLATDWGMVSLVFEVRDDS